MPDTPFLLKPREVAKAVRKSMAGGWLGYQRHHVECRYRYDDGARCAIGCALPEEVAKLADNAENELVDEIGHAPETTSVGELVDFGLFAVENQNDVELLKSLQRAHDNVCSGGGTRAEFLTALEACEAA